MTVGLTVPPPIKEQSMPDDRKNLEARKKKNT
jgi:hypothetical protein